MRKWFLYQLIGLLLFISSFVYSPHTFGEEAAKIPIGKLVKVEAEIIEVEELKEPLGAAIYTVKDLSSGATLRLFADPFKTLVQTGGETMGAADVFGGSKATILYRNEDGKDLPQVVFVKITATYYG